jgi:hypothetical protein
MHPEMNHHVKQLATTHQIVLDLYCIMVIVITKIIQYQPLHTYLVQHFTILDLVLQLQLKLQHQVVWEVLVVRLRQPSQRRQGQRQLKQQLESKFFLFFIIIDKDLEINTIF